MVAIIGILAAIAIPQFADYKRRAFNTRAQSDLRNALTGQEAYFTDNEEYVDCNGPACETLLPGFVLSDDSVSLDMNAQISNGEFTGSSCHLKGDRAYWFVTAGSEPGVMTDGAIALGSCGAAAPII